MKTTRFPWFVAATAALFLAVPASADTTSDLKKCRATLSEEGRFDNAEQTLKFSHRKGNTRKRTVYLTLRDRDSESRHQVACRLERQHITGITLIPKS